jgi:methyltransferase (TIGR00027 family)
MPRGASITAEAVCFFRAVETLRPAPRRVLCDPFARHFLGPAWRIAADAPLTRHLFSSHSALSSLTDFGAFGLQRFVAARHRFIDDALVDFLASGGEQVVVLGAGFDARALRFGEALGERPLFEVDFPATQDKKRRALDAAIGRGHIKAETARTTRWLPIDFEQTTLENGLLQSPFSPDLKTFYIWEGVSMYLRPATVSATLETLARISVPGSELALDLWTPPTARHPIAALRRSGARMLALLGEPLHFALQPSEAPDYFGERGFRICEMLDARALARRYGLVESAIFSDICVARLALA